MNRKQLGFRGTHFVSGVTARESYLRSDDSSPLRSRNARRYGLRNGSAAESLTPVGWNVFLRRYLRLDGWSDLNELRPFPDVGYTSPDGDNDGAT
jgi:hypothetical protein